MDKNLKNEKIAKQGEIAEEVYRSRLVDLDHDIFRNIVIPFQSFLGEISAEIDVISIKNDMLIVEWQIYIITTNFGCNSY